MVEKSENRRGEKQLTRMRKVPLPGHFPPEVGRAMEDSFVNLLYRLGYTTSSERDPASGLDVIAKFYGEPINPTPSNACKLLPPFFAPKGMTAFSLKRGNFAKKDVIELVEKFQKAKNSADSAYRALEGMVIVTNYSRTEEDIDKLLLQKVYCWDGRRLIFYSAKARFIQELASRGPVQEIAIEVVSNSSYLIETETLKNAILANIVILIDNHDKRLIISSEQMEKMLVYIYDNSLKPIVQSTQLDVQVLLKIHTLGIANETIVKNSYNKYARENSFHPKVFFSAEPMIFQYGAAPWATLFRQ